MEFSDLVLKGVPYFHDDRDLDNLLEKCSYLDKEEQEKVVKAYWMGKKAHDGLKREGGEPYFIHPYTVAIYACYFGLSANLIIASLLHDTVEDTFVTLDDIEASFGSDVAVIVDGVTKLDNFSSKEEKMAVNMSKLFRTFLHSSPEVFLVKLLDKVHNMSTIDKKKNRAKQIENSKEALYLFAPMARNLGCGSIRSMLEDRSFHCINPSKYNQIVEDRDYLFKKTKDESQEIMEALKESLKRKGIGADIDFKMKEIYSIEKSLEKGINYDLIHDLRAFRVVVPDVSSCYAALESIHQFIVPIQHHMKDYIASPKTNRYQSFHTTGYSKAGTQYQVRIRTENMKMLAENGICVFANRKDTTMAKELEHYQFYQILKSLDQMMPNDLEFYPALQEQVLSEHIYVNLSDGTKHELPKNATVLDLICTLGAENLLHFSTAVRNGKSVSLGTPLTNEDSVVLYPRGEVTPPNLSMLNECKTPYAKKILYNLSHHD